MSIVLFAIIVLTLFIIVLAYLQIRVKEKVEHLREGLDTVLSKHILMIRELGVAEGNVEGIAIQVAKQEKIDRGIAQKAGEHEITGTLKGIITPSK